MVYLITGFDRFNNLEVNPSLELLKILDIDDKVNFKLRLPVEWVGAFETLDNTINEVKPDYVIMMGACNSDKFYIETTAKNYHDVKLMDNVNAELTHDYIIRNGKEKLTTSFDPLEFLKGFNELNIPCEISNDAGNFVCNETYYKCLAKYPSIKSIFIHIPTKMNLDEVINKGIKVFDYILKNILK